MTPEAQAEILNRFPEVRWDRTAGDDESRAVYGWVDRPGSIRADFVVLVFTDPDGLGFVTSSVAWSADFHARLYGVEDDDHHPCVPVVDHYGALVPGTIRAPKLDASMLGQ
jgi:hypothetical protein